MNKPSQRGPRAAARRQSRGQALLIFALSGTVLFALIGLAVDSGISYADSAAVERVAAASALAGVTYMPDNFNGALPCPASPQTVQCEVAQVAAANGFSTTAPNPNNITIVPTEVDPNTGANCVAACSRNQLRVTVSEDVHTSFLQLVGFGTHRVTRSARAEYLRPVTLGQPGPQLGSAADELGCPSDVPNPCNAYYFIRSEGWGVPRSEGDAFTPNPDGSASGAKYRSGPDNAYDGTAGPCNGSTPAVPPATCPNYKTNLPDTHQLNSAAGTETLDALPAGWTAPAARGGYDYLIHVPAGTTVTVQVYNPAFAPDGNANDPTSGFNYHESDGSGLTNSDPRTYSTMAYTLYNVPNIFNHNSDHYLSQAVVNPVYLNGGKWSSVKGVADPTNGGNPLPNNGTPKLYHSWVDVGTTYTGNSAPDTALVSFHPNSPVISYPLTAGAKGSYYRLRIDTLDVNGGDPQSTGLLSGAHKGSAIRVIDNSTGTTCAGCSVGAIDELAFYTPVNKGSFTIPLMAIPPEYAGQTVSVFLFDPGDIGGASTNVLTIYEPDQSTVAPASKVVFLGPSLTYQGFTPPLPSTTSSCAPGGSSGKAIVQAICSQFAPGLSATPNIYNGTWLRFDIQVPGNYAPGNNEANWFWYLNYATDATAGDTLTVSVNFNGAPVHLIGV